MGRESAANSLDQPRSVTHSLITHSLSHCKVTHLTHSLTHCQSLLDIKPLNGDNAMQFVLLFGDLSITTILQF